MRGSAPGPAERGAEATEHELPQAAVPGQGLRGGLDEPDEAVPRALRLPRLPGQGDRALEPSLVHLVDQVVLVGEPPVHRRDTHPGPGGDLGLGGRRPALGEDLGRSPHLLIAGVATDGCVLQTVMADHVPEMMGARAFRHGVERGKLLTASA